MKIKAIHSWSVSMPLSAPYTISYERVEKAFNIFLHFETNEDISGFGCAAPDKEVTGETQESAFDAIAKIESLLKGSDPLRNVMILEKAKTILKENPSVLAAIDMALYDILGKKCGLPLWKILGGFRDRIKTSITIGIMSAEETVKIARSWVSQGFKSIKLKGGNSVESDIERVLKVREALGTSIGIRFDANQGFSLEDTMLFVKETRKANLELIEQPISKDRPELLEMVTNRIPIPVMADESLLSLGDAFRIAKGGLADMVNIKLMKVGGISEAMRINSVARSAGLEAMVGCMDESALGISAGLHFALSRSNVEYADLDGHIGLINDPFRDAMILRDGTLFPKSKPGLGADISDYY